MALTAEEKRAYNRDYYRRWRAANLKYALERCRRYRLANLEERRDYDRLYHLAHRDKRIAQMRRRRAERRAQV